VNDPAQLFLSFCGEQIRLCRPWRLLLLISSVPMSPLLLLRTIPLEL
jgi:hypothetical protein